ncbi:TetR/AcrR family transcriptional regulator [Acinetobacter sp. NIPH 1852]|uniref:TetR/AcrR family transcriptional regulator n=1 Tax=Acinetobacter sp. NIPH 1852 TaxID=2923428 RepID=UPI001B65D581|nr:TetR/AcrR family transcriptional regulator [Acinetobacter sp. NIPH 1852]MBP7880214.1 TetR/AcrR family transcriptional regulator [Acinetobacter sp.]MCH7308451.1 TetR/AcrR family transcriptional regulator [Acinetobacter sp. NIPH 1852]
MSKSASKILNTAEKLFYENSFVGVGVDLIRDESGCSKTTMYTYFKNKNQLVRSVLESRDAKFRQRLITYIGNATGVEALNQLIDWHLLWFQEDNFKGCLFVRAVAESHLGDQEIIMISKQHKIWIRALIAKCLESNPHADALVEIIYTLIEGLISRFLVEGYDAKIAADIKSSINQIVDAFSHSSL